MNSSSIGRRDWLKLGGLGGIAALLSSQSGKAQEKGSGKSPEVRGIVFMVSDGMSQGILTMAENFSKIVNGKSTRWWELINDPKAARGLMETSSANSYVTDSSAASSAWGGGAKINNGSVNVRPDGSESVPILRHLKSLGHRTALVTTTTITHATPAGFAAVSRSRGDEHLIALQYAGVVDILMGGGMKFFDKKQRVDSKDALAVFEKAGYQLLRDRDALLASKEDGGRVLGLFNDDHLPMEIDRMHVDDLRKKTPTLAEMSSATLKRLLPGDKKFLMQIEGGRVDHAAHANDIAGLLWDQLAFDKALAEVLELVGDRDDILVIVTSDHGNANPGLNGTGPGYTGSNKAFEKITQLKASHERLFYEWGVSKENNQKGLSKFISEKLGFDATEKESEALFSSLTSGEVAEWSKQLANPNGILGQIAGNHTGIGWTGTSHTSDPTMLSAIGPQSERFTGIVPNNEVYRHFMEILG